MGQGLVEIGRGLGPEVRDPERASSPGWTPLLQGPCGVDGGGSPRAVIASCRLLLLLATVLANEGAILVELDVNAAPIVSQAVITAQGLDVSIEGWLAAVKNLLLVVAAEAEGRSGGSGRLPGGPAGAGLREEAWLGGLVGPRWPRLCLPSICSEFNGEEVYIFASVRANGMHTPRRTRREIS